LEDALQVLYEDNHCLVVDKPAGVLVQPDPTGDPTIVDLAREDIRRRHGKPGNVFVVAVHRLDRPVSGVLLLARTSKAATRLSAQFRAGTVGKIYWARVERPPAPAAATLEHTLVKDSEHNRVHVVPPGTAGGRLARLHYTTLATDPRSALVEVRLETGRAHQIRVQLATIGCVIVGDLRYGSRHGLGARILLHARSLAFDHPTRGERIVVEAPLPEAWDEAKH